MTTSGKEKRACLGESQPSGRIGKLLYWSYSPFIAAYFAFPSVKFGDGQPVAIWALLNDRDKSFFTSDPESSVRTGDSGSFFMPGIANLQFRAKPRLQKCRRIK